MSDIHDIDIQSLDHDQLVKFGYRIQTEMADLKKVFDKVKAEMGERTKRPGTRVVGSAAVRMHKTRTFKKELAAKNLNQRQLRKISSLVPDSKLAQAEFGKDSELYRSLCQEGDWVITIENASTEKKVKDADGILADPFVEDSN